MTEVPRVGRASAVLAAGTIVSRVLGFLSMALLTWVIGLNNPSANAFALAQTLPQTLLLLIAGGFLSSFLVPQIVKAAGHPDAGRAFTNRLVTLGVVGFAGVTLIATAGAPVLIALFTVSDENLDDQGVALATAFAFWCLPQLFFFALSSLLGEVLNARGVFGPSAWAPVFTNVTMIVGLLGFAAAYGIDPSHRNPADWDTVQIIALGLLPTFSVAVQSLVLMLAWRRAGLSWRPDFRWRGVGLGEVGRTAGWAFGMIVINQLAGIVQVNLALTAGAADASLNALRVAWAIFVLPHSLIAVSIATPYFTRMSSHAAEHRLASLAADLSQSLRVVGLLTVGAAAALAASAVPFVRLFAADAEEALATAPVLIGYLVGLLPFSALYLVHRAFYALGDTRTPFLIQIVQAVAFVGLASAGVAAVSGAWVAAVIALAISFAGIVQAGLAAGVLRRRLVAADSHGGRRVARQFTVFALAAIPATVAGLALTVPLGAVSFPTAGFTGSYGVEAGAGFAMADRVSALISTALIGVVVFGIYLALLRLLRVPELGELARALRRIIRR